MAASTRADGRDRNAVGTAPPRHAGVAALVLVRLATGPATRAHVARDLAALSPLGDLDPDGWQAAVDAEATAAIEAGRLARSGVRLTVTPAGAADACRHLALGPDTDLVKLAQATLSVAPRSVAARWPAVRDGPLTIAALGADPADRKLAAAVAEPDGLRALVVQMAYGFGVERVLSLGKLRARLAVVALERAFGDELRSALGGDAGGLAAKPSRLLAAKLLRTPRACPSDGRLVAALAADALGLADGEMEMVRAALIRRWAAALDVAAGTRPDLAVPPGPVNGAASTDGRTARPPETRPPDARTADTRTPVPRAGSGGRLSLMPARPATPAPTTSSTATSSTGDAPAPEVPPAVRPGLAAFVAAVRAAAEACAEGWPGNRKAYISRVWAEIGDRHPGWALSEIEFKAMLAEAHRTGGLVLATADLKDKRHMRDVDESAIRYKNTVWHLVRVEEG